MVQLHLLVVQSEREGQRSQNVVIGQDAQYPPQSQTQASTVVLEVAVVDEHEARLKEKEKGEDGLVDILRGGVREKERERGRGRERERERERERGERERSVYKAAEYTLFSSFQHTVIPIFPP